MKTIKLNNKEIKFRKWKGKDKKKFIRQISTQMDNQDLKFKETVSILIDSVLEDNNVIYSQQEYRYILSKIREYSLGDEMKIEMKCPECHLSNIHEYNISDVIKPIHETLSTYDDGETIIKFGKIKNKDIFFKYIDENPDYEMFFRIEEFNENRDFSIDDLMEAFDDLDIGTIQNIVDYYEDNKFRIDDHHELKCKCGYSEVYEFDEIPGFFPKEWFEDTIKDILIQERKKIIQEQIQKQFNMTEVAKE